MQSIRNSLFCLAVGLSLVGWATLPTETDILIAGGTTAAVERALRAKAEGKRVFVVSPRPFFGEETAGRLEFAPLPVEEEPVGRPVALKPAADGSRARCTLETDPADEITTVELVTDEMPYGKSPRATEEAHFIFSEDGKTYSRVLNLKLEMNYGSHWAHTWRATLNRRVRAIAVGTTKRKKSARIPSGTVRLFRRCQPGATRLPTPLEAKTALDAKLRKAGIDFLTGALPIEVLTDGAGRVTGAAFATREGVKRIRAKETVDASLHGVLVRAAGGALQPLPPTLQLSRVIVSTERPSADGLAVDALGRTLSTAVQRRGARDLVVTGAFYRCSFAWKTDDTPLGWAAAEQTARRLTWTKGQIDAADELGFPIRRCARCAKGLSFLACDGQFTVGTEDVRVTPAFDLGACDVGVAGVGTAGAPALIAAARSGATVVGIDYQYGLGGLGTLGMIGYYWYGTICGFTAEVESGIKALDALVQGVGKREWWRRTAVAAGARLLLGSMAYDVVTDGRTVVGLRVATPLGAGVLRTKTVVDATGAADLAAAAGERTEFIGASDLTLQSAGLAPRRPGSTYVNTDFGYVNDNDAADTTLWGVRARAGAKGEWDVSSVVGTRERRHLRGGFRVEPEDVINRRTFPDTIATGTTDFDTHGPTVADVCFLSPATDEHVFKLNIPYRALLPEKTDGLLVAGLGASAQRDAQPFMRMQADVQNEGYAAGRAAAMSAKRGVPPRAIDVKELQRHLAEIGSIPREALTWTDNFPLSDAAWRAAVVAAGDAFKGAPLVLTDKARARTDIRAAFAAETDARRRLAYAQILGMLGDASGAEVLAENLTSARPIELISEGAKRFGKRMSNRDAQLVALGRTRAPCAVPVILREIKTIKPDDSQSRLRAIALASAALADARLAPALAEKLRLPVFADAPCASASDLPPLGGFTRTAGGYERSRVQKSLALARALDACGDCDGLARRILTKFAADPRGVYSAHARAILQEKVDCNRWSPKLKIENLTSRVRPL